MAAVQGWNYCNSCFHLNCCMGRDDRNGCNPHALQTKIPRCTFEKVQEVVNQIFILNWNRRLGSVWSAGVSRWLRMDWSGWMKFLFLQLAANLSIFKHYFGQSTLISQNNTLCFMYDTKTVHW